MDTHVYPAADAKSQKFFGGRAGQTEGEWPLAFHDCPEGPGKIPRCEEVA